MIENFEAPGSSNDGTGNNMGDGNNGLGNNMGDGNNGLGNNMGDGNNGLGNNMGEGNNVENEEINSIGKELSGLLENNSQSVDDSVDSMTHQEKMDLRKKCKAIDTEGVWGTIVSKYSGKVINVESLGEVQGVTKYLIKWQPLGGKPGGCITCNADGTYSTPICNDTINKQQWVIIKIKNENQWTREISEERRNMGRALNNTEYPFYIVQSVEYPNYVLNYEGGGLSIREKANYDGQKWDVSTEKIKQDPLPTQESSKFTSLTPGHNMRKTDIPIGSLLNGSTNNNVDSKNNSEDAKGVNFNINLDPDLLMKLGLGLSGNGDNSIASNSGDMGNSTLSEEQRRTLENPTGGRGNVSEMLQSGDPNCKNCDKIPENFIKKDLVKSMCIGCNNIDNVLT
jgi:hypothetical protein